MGLGGWQKPSQFKALWAMVKDMTEIFFTGGYWVALGERDD